jgi:hypothetical protein
MIWKDSIGTGKGKKKEVLYLSDTRSNIASPISLAAMKAAYDSQTNAIRTHIRQPIISTPLIGYWRELAIMLLSRQSRPASLHFGRSALLLNSWT